jgi:cell shape-determining protein MreC
MNLEKIMKEKNAVLEAVTKKCQKLESENKQLRDALQWYSKTVGNCNRRGTEGDVARQRLAKDVGKRADEALEAEDELS